MRQHKPIVLLAALLLAACSSTQPQSTQVPASAAGQTTRTAVAATPTSLALDTDGPVTPSMAGLQISGERYAALGDPAAPVTMVEMSDFG